MPIPSLPLEIVYYIFDFLHDDTTALKQLCLASKSWVPRTREHLFNHVCFREIDHRKAWKKYFPPDLDPAQSPACYTRSLSFHHAEYVTDADSNWIRAFAKVVELKICIDFFWVGPNPYSLAPFHNLSGSSVKSLELSWTHYTTLQSQAVFDFIFSFPHLEDLDVEGQTPPGAEAISLPPHLPVFTGKFVFRSSTRCDFVNRMLELPIPLCFRTIVWKWRPTHEAPNNLVERCSKTLENIDIYDSCTSTPSCSVGPCDRFNI